MGDPAFDVVIVGAGPAGATAALNLAPLHSVALVDSRARPVARIGESLPSAAGRLLDDMGLLAGFRRTGPLPCYANRFVWGSPVPEETDGLHTPDGPGWHLDRVRFETWLRGVACDRGAVPFIPSRVASIRRVGERWVVHLQGGPALRARFLVDAGGRAAPLARRLGARLRRSDRLIARWTQGAGRPDGCGAGVTHVEAVESGWWYTAPAPGGRRLLAFHTDGDLPAARARNLLARAHEVRELGRILAGCGFAPDSPFRSVAAHTAVLEPATGADWLAAGDAALGLDPLSSQGLLNALYMGLAAAESVARSLEGDIGALADYAATLRGIETAYRRNLGDCYGSERRWPDAPFWRRRMAAYVEAGSHG